MEPNPKDEMIIERATAEMKMRENDPVILHIDIKLAVSLVSQLQLAFRHPANTGTQRDATEQFTRDLIDRLDPMRTELYQLLMMGFDQRFDQPAEEDLDWNHALKHFREVRSQYQELAGTPEVNTTLALEAVFRPISVRYHRGERTAELYREMMAVE